MNNYFSEEEEERRLKRDGRIHSGEPFRQYIGKLCSIASDYHGQEGRFFYRTGIVTMVTFDYLFIDCGKTLSRIPFREIVEIKVVEK